MNVVVSLPQLIARRVSLSYPYRQTHTHTNVVVSLPQLIVRRVSLSYPYRQTHTHTHTNVLFATADCTTGTFELPI